MTYYDCSGNWWLFMLWQDSRATHSLKEYAYWDIDYIKAGPLAVSCLLTGMFLPRKWTRPTRLNPAASQPCQTLSVGVPPLWHAGFHLARREGLRPSKRNFPPQRKGPTPSGLKRLCTSTCTSHWPCTHTHTHPRWCAIRGSWVDLDWSACFWVRLKPLSSKWDNAGTILKQQVGFGIVDPQFFRSGQHPITRLIQVIRRANGQCMKWASEGTRLSLLHVEMVKFGWWLRTENWPDQRKTPSKCWTVGCCGFISKGFQGNLHSKRWPLHTFAVAYTHVCSYLGSTLHGQSTKLLEVEANRAKKPIPAATTVVGKFQEIVVYPKWWLMTVVV